MKKFLIKKWKESRGETLVEVLASILVGSLSVMVLVTLIITSVHINDGVKDIDKDYYDALSKAEQQTVPMTGGGAGEVTITPDSPVAGTPIEIQIPVEYYGGDKIFSYKIKKP